jgi:hypothetical protein
MAATTGMMTTGDAALTGAAIESLVLRGDISALNPHQKTQYYAQLCERVGLDPATTPFQPLKLNGKEIFYATKGAAEQLRKLHRISIAIVSREQISDVYYVTARATMADGRTDESQGAVSIGGLKGEPLANAIMKAETKAKRRVTLSIVGLGMLDESELDTIQSDRFAALPKEEPRAANVRQLEPKPAAKPQPKWTIDQPIPEAILKSLPPPVRELAGIAVAELTEDDLDLLVEQGKKAYDAWKQMPNVSPKALGLLQGIVLDAAGLLAQLRGDAPPVNAPSADEPPPPDFDPVTGEVLP